MTDLKGKSDYTLFFTVHNANPNGDPVNDGAPRTDNRGYGLITDKCIKRKIRNRFQDMGLPVFYRMDGRGEDDGFRSLADRADGYPELKEETHKKKGADEKLCQELTCAKWADVRPFGANFALKNWGGIPFGVTGAVSIEQAVSLGPVDIMDIQITKCLNGESGVDGKSSDRFGMMHIVPFAVYRVNFELNYNQAEINGLMQKDADLFKEALLTLFENDASSARPAGSMVVRRLYHWQHETRRGISAAKIQESFVINKVADEQKFSDYDIRWDPVEGCVMPEIIEP